MKETYRILILTDHSAHSKENSLYAIVRELILSERCKSVSIASRGNDLNASFFKSPNSENIFVKNVGTDFEFDPTGRQFIDSCESVLPLVHDIVFMRLPRPISDDALKELSALFCEKIIINNPLGIIESSNKKFLLNFPDLCPPIQFCNSIEDVLAFSSKYETVLKPLREYGGKGILRIKGEKVDDGEHVYDLLPYIRKMEDQLSEGYIAMQFLKNVKNGDKRSLVVDGQILASSLRMPAEGSWLCNVSRGGVSIEAEPTDNEKRIVELIHPKLKELGILIYGIDTLENDEGIRVLSEINTLSIGGFPQAQALSGKPIIKQMVDKIFDYADGI